MVFYYLTIYLAFLATGFPVGMLSIIWPLISEKLTVAIPYISLVRAMIAAGGVIACILSGRKVWKQDRALDLCLTGVSLETLGVIGLSLSRLFWHLLLQLLLRNLPELWQLKHLSESLTCYPDLKR